MCKNCNCGNNRYKKITEIDLRIEFKNETGLSPERESNFEIYNQWVKRKLIEERNKLIDDAKYVDDANAEFNSLKQNELEEFNKIIENEL